MLKVGTVIEGRKIVEVKKVKSLYLNRLMAQIKAYLKEGWEIDETSFRTPIGLITGNLVRFEDVAVGEENTESNNGESTGEGEGGDSNEESETETSTENKAESTGEGEGADEVETPTETESETPTETNTEEDAPAEAPKRRNRAKAKPDEA